MKPMDGQLSNLEAAMLPAERRRATRFRVTWPVRIRGLDNAGLRFEEYGELGNLSSGGALARMDRALQAGWQAEVYIRVPFGKATWMKYKATISRVENGTGPAALGIRFSTSRPQFLIE